MSAYKYYEETESTPSGGLQIKHRQCPHGYFRNEFCSQCSLDETLEAAKANDVQEGGDHYKTMGVQPWDVYDTWPEEQRIGAYRANCIKYAMRLDAKDTRSLNAKKLAHYARKLVEVVEELEK